jgi:hypothetical protein
MRRSLALVAVLVAGCGSGGGGGSEDLRGKVETRFAKEGVKLHELSGFYSGGPEVSLAPDSRAKFGDFVVHIIKDPSGFAVQEQTASAPDKDGIRWDDTLATHEPPYFTSYTRYGDKLELQWSSGRRSTDSADWKALDAIMKELS